jgi:hypothetical protein
VKDRLTEVGLSVVVLFLLAASVRLGLLQSLLTNPTTEFSYAGIFVLYLCSAPSRYEAGMVGVAGLAIRLVAGSSTPHDNDYWLEPFVRLVALMGFASVAALAIRSVFGKAPKAAVAMLVRILIFAVLGVGLGQIVNLASRLRPLKFDAYLYAIERGYGFLPNVVAARWFAAVPWLMQLELLVYYSLPLGLAVVYAVHLNWPRGKTDILFLLYMNALVGFSLYLLYPACGPIYAFGSVPALAAVDLRPMALDCKPNAMPSLHFAGALLMCWNLHSFGRLRVLAFFYCALTALATLGFREHYAIDLIVGAPYALLIQALATDSRGRVRAGMVAAVLLLAWLILLRFAVPVLAGSRSLLWSSSLATIAITWASLRRLMMASEGSGSTSR